MTDKSIQSMAGYPSTKKIIWLTKKDPQVMQASQFWIPMTLTHRVLAPSHRLRRECYLRHLTSHWRPKMQIQMSSTFDSSRRIIISGAKRDFSNMYTMHIPSCPHDNNSFRFSKQILWTTFGLQCVTWDLDTYLDLHQRRTRWNSTRFYQQIVPLRRMRLWSKQCFSSPWV